MNLKVLIFVESVYSTSILLAARSIDSLCEEPGHPNSEPIYLVSLSRGFFWGD